MAAGTFEGTNNLVVGGAGFVGSNLVSALNQSGASRIHIVDNLLSAERTPVLELPDGRVRRGLDHGRPCARCAG